MEGSDPCPRHRDDEEGLFPRLAGGVFSGARLPPCPARPHEKLGVAPGAARGGGSAPGHAHPAAQECHPRAPELRRAEPAVA